MRIPKSIKRGDTLGFVAPSFGAATEPYKSAFLHALERFEALGYKTLLGPNAMAGEGIGISNTPEKCGNELTDFYTRSDSDALMAVGGGELMCEGMDFVDFERIKNAEPKWYMGYSDNTNFTFLLPTLCDTAAVYGPCAATFGMEPWDESLADAFRLLTGEQRTFYSYDSWEKEKMQDTEHPYAPYNRTEPAALRFANYDGAPVEGRFIGGCMDVLQMLVGTKYDRVNAFTERYREDGIIWFLESCEMNTTQTVRCLWQMRNAGWFKHVKAFVFGRPGYFYDTSFGIDQFEAALRETVKADRSIPVIFNADIGHLPPQTPIISGGYGCISVSEGRLKFTFTDR